MSDKLPTSLQSHLSGNRTAVGRLMERVAAQARLTASVLACLPPDLAPHCRSATRDHDRLVLAFDSPAWAQRARYLLPRFDPRLRSALGEAWAPPVIQVSRSGRGPERKPAGTRKGTRPGISARSRETIRGAARCIDDPELRAALERLASRD
jgi:hypothetical protein